MDTVTPRRPVASTVALREKSSTAIPATVRPLTPLHRTTAARPAAQSQAGMMLRPLAPASGSTLGRDRVTTGGLRAAAPAVANPLQLANRGLRRMTAGNDAQLYVDGRTAYPALEKLIQGAKKTLYIETMIWHNDETGRRIAQAVVDAKKRGVDVKIMVDSIGQNFGTGRHSDPTLLAWMRSQGVEAHTFNENFATHQGVPITHHKVYIADNERFLTGGMNIGNEYEHEWHDMLVGIEGPAAREVAREFGLNWTRTTGQTLDIPAASPIEKLRAHPPGTAAVGIAVTDPVSRRYEMRQTNLRLINEAKHHIRVEMPYCSDDDMMNALKAAAQRGVNVEFIMPGVNDTGTFGTMNPTEAVSLVKAGVKVRFYDGGTVDGQAIERFSHLKMMIVDDAVAQVGSGNWDHRTFHNNHELNAYVADPAFVGTLKQSLWDKDWTESRPATLESLDQRRTIDKVQGVLLRAIDRFF
jgi:cardiolipin synthase